MLFLFSKLLVFYAVVMEVECYGRGWCEKTVEICM